MYDIDLSEEAKQFFEAASAKLQQRLDRAFEQIKSNPRFHPNIKPLKGDYAGYYRYRVGDYRIVYSIDDKRVWVLVTTIANRSEVYEWTREGEAIALLLNRRRTRAMYQLPRLGVKGGIRHFGGGQEFVNQGF